MMRDGRPRKGGTEAASQREGVGVVLDRAVSWARGQPDIRAIAVVGSYARERQSLDSDLDLLLLTTSPNIYTVDDGWIAKLDAGELIASREWGAVTERRLSGIEGIEIDIGIAQPRWASTCPVDPGTHKVVRDGLRILYDPDRLLEQLLQAC